MEITECKNNIRCELGACRNRATHAVKFDRVGIKSRLYMCDKCMRELYDRLGKTVVPKSVETAKRKKKDGEIRVKEGNDEA